MITMGSMSRSVKEQNIVGLDPRTNLITPLDAVPILAGAAKVRQGTRLATKGASVMHQSFRMGQSYFSNKYAVGYGKFIVANRTIDGVYLGGKAVIRGSAHAIAGITGGLSGYHLVHENSIKLANIIVPEKHSRGLDTSLTSVSKGPGTGTTQRAKRTKRTLSPRLSKGDNENRSSRRKTSYCNVHKKYDFCKYYKR